MYKIYVVSFVENGSRWRVELITPNKEKAEKKLDWLGKCCGEDDYASLDTLEDVIDYGIADLWCDVLEELASMFQNGELIIKD